MVKIIIAIFVGVLVFWLAYGAVQRFLQDKSEEMEHPYFENKKK